MAHHPRGKTAVFWRSVPLIDTTKSKSESLTTLTNQIGITTGDGAQKAAVHPRVKQSFEND